MRVKAGEYQKEIPQEYAGAVKLLTLADWEKPERIRLTPMERFKFAEAAWRVRQKKNIQEYLDGHKPEQIILQTNREGKIRTVIRYDEVDGKRCVAIIPKWVFRACPLDLTSHQYENWKE